MGQEQLPEHELRSGQSSAVSPAFGREAINSFGQPHPILQLQSSLGNRRVAELIRAKRLTPEGTILPLAPNRRSERRTIETRSKRTLLRGKS